MTTRTIEYLDVSGHIALEWDPADPNSVERARTDFHTLQAAGYSFFRVVAQQVGDFDPTFGALEVRRIDASEAEPRLEVKEPVQPARRGRPKGSRNKPKEPAQHEGRVVAARPMRGG